MFFRIGSVLVVLFSLFWFGVLGFVKGCCFEFFIIFIFFGFGFCIFVFYVFSYGFISLVLVFILS